MRRLAEPNHHHSRYGTPAPLVTYLLPFGLLKQLCNQSRPTRLMTGTDATARIVICQDNRVVC